MFGRDQIRWTQAEQAVQWWQGAQVLTTSETSATAASDPGEKMTEMLISKSDHDQCASDEHCDNKEQRRYKVSWHGGWNKTLESSQSSFHILQKCQRKTYLRTKSILMFNFYSMSRSKNIILRIYLYFNSCRSVSFKRWSEDRMKINETKIF